MGSRVRSVKALEVLDSRGFPTVRATVVLEGGATGTATVPSGASTGEHEAVELRDGDKRRYAGKGVLKAVAHVNDVLAPALVGCDARSQVDVDRTMIELDGTPNKAKMGANAILAVSMAVARAAAAHCGLPLYAYLGGPGANRLPVPMMNIVNGGLHADNSVDFQEFMVMPVGAPSFAEALRWGSETFHALKAILREKGYATSVGDEGGFAPDLKSNDEACELIMQAIQKAGYEPGRDVAIALDPACSSLFGDGSYDLFKSRQGRRSTAQMIELFTAWVEKYPIVSIEDALNENDWAGFTDFTSKLGGRIQVVGDDLFVTNPEFIRRGVREKAANAVLIKVNQIGTLTETMEAIGLCREAGWGYIISHRSGETEDAFIADFAVAMGGAQIKTGSASRSDRLAKYNRLLEIEAELGRAASFVAPRSLRR